MTPNGWRKSSFCGSQPHCPEVWVHPDGAWMRDSKDPDGPVLRFNRGEWGDFLIEMGGAVSDNPE